MIHKIRYQIHPEDIVLLNEHGISESLMNIMLYIEQENLRSDIIGVNDFLVVYNKVLEVCDGKVESDYE